jgi:hypothetical protein
MIKKKKESGKIEIDLTGPQGNAFNLLGIATKLCKELDKDYESISEKMKSGDYDNLVKVFDDEFGDYVILYN